MVKDDLGREVRLPLKIERAISLAPNITEMVFAIGAGDRLVGVTTYCNYPEEARAIQKVGDTLNPNIEAIVALRPDLVFVSTASQLQQFTSVLERHSIAVYVTNPTSLDGVFNSMLQLGAILDREDQAANLTITLESRAHWIKEHALYDKRDPDAKRVEPLTTFVQISKEPLFTVGKDSFLTEIVEIAGGESVTRNISGGYPQLSKETAIALQPEAIILSDSDDNKEPNDAFRNSPAVKNGKVFKVTADLLSRPGPRLVDALEQIAKDLHPEKFQDN